jgi:tetratricopeptide (TPR) repeat protein
MVKAASERSGAVVVSVDRFVSVHWTLYGGTMAQDAPTVGLALIVKNEADSLPALLESIEGAFDAVVLVDTGSKDATVPIFAAWAKEQDGLDWQVADFAWVDDFAAARTFADSLLDTDWTCWADADDVLAGAQNLRQLAADAPPEVVAYVAHYAYAHDSFGNCVCTLKRERLVRRGHGTWWGRVHEAQLLDGPTITVDPGVVQWIHRKSLDAKPSQPRNLRILRKWNRDEPNQPRVLGYLGTELAATGRHKQALAHYRAYLRLKTGWDEERCQIHRKHAMSLLALGRLEEAKQTAHEAMNVMPLWPDSYLTLAQACYQAGEWEKAAQWAHRVLELGQPDSLLILNPLDYTLQPKLVIAGAYGALGRHDEAIAIAQECLQVVPHQPALQASVAEWRSVSKRESTAAFVTQYAGQLVAHDEQLKALTFLQDAVPYYAHDHPEVVAMRSALRERVAPLLEPAGTAQHYESGTEGGYEDISAVASLPRARMLAEGILEQAQEAGRGR